MKRGLWAVTKEPKGNRVSYIQGPNVTTCGVVPHHISLSDILDWIVCQDQCNTGDIVLMPDGPLVVHPPGIA